MKNIKYLIGLFLLMLVFVSCQEEKYEFGDLVSPSNIEVTATIVGQDVNNPNGDGTGEVKFTMTADNALMYKFVYDGAEKLAPTGEVTYFFGETGTKLYTVTAVAIGTGGLTSSEPIEVEVRVDYNPPADLLELFVGTTGSRTFRIKNEEWGHFGVGPAEATWQEWWGAEPDQKADVGAYDDRFIFNEDGTFTHITNGDTFGKAGPLDTDIGNNHNLTADSNDEYALYPLDDYTESWSLSAPGGIETITFTGIGYHGFYVGGDHSYQIISRTADQMLLKTIGAGGISWWVILVAVDE